MTSLKNKVALITGASQGIGESIALNLSAHGCSVALVARNEARLAEVAKKCEIAGAANVMTISADLTDLENLESIVTQTVEKLGKLNILINNAGVYQGGNISECNILKWDNAIDLNFKSIVHLTHHASKEIKKTNDGGVINISSIAGKITYKGGALYCSTKHALTGFSGSIYDDLRENNIKVCTIYPGFVNTEMGREDHLDETKMIQPEDIAKTVEFVLSFPNTGCPTEITIRPQQNSRKG